MNRHTLDRLHEMRLLGMAEGYSEQQIQPAIQELSFDERLGLLVDQEWTYRRDRRQARLLKGAKLRLEACMEDLDYKQPRGLNRQVMTALFTCEWIRNQQAVLITGPTGSGKTYIACALGHTACRHGISARYYRLPRLVSELALAQADGSFPKLLTRLAKIQLLILDDWGITPLGGQEARNLLEVIDDRAGVRSTTVASQLPIEQWHQTIADPTVADAILDRLVHRAHQITLRGESMRKVANTSTDAINTTTTIDDDQNR